MLCGTTQARRTVKFWIFFHRWRWNKKCKSEFLSHFNKSLRTWRNIVEPQSSQHLMLTKLKHWCWVESYSRAGTNPNNQVFWADRLYSSNCLFILCLVTCSWTAVWNMVKWLENYLLLCWTFIFFITEQPFAHKVRLKRLKMLLNSRYLL